MRGEHKTWVMRLPAFLGSSPHARGTPRSRIPLRIRQRIIPACAGNTVELSFPPAGLRDHPRMRGEHPHWTCRSSARGGSSPHARGTLVSHHRENGADGIIPACAGNTPCSAVSRFGVRDHPRMRGEHLDFRSSMPFLMGSSPHARGTLYMQHVDIVSIGIIPACAGNTLPDECRRFADGDHPRMRGEHSCTRLTHVRT